MTLTDKATAAAKNPWGQWSAVILALVGLGTQYVQLEQTKADLAEERKVLSERRLDTSRVGGAVDEKLAESLADTQEKLIAVWKQCESATTESRAHAMKQDDAILEQRHLTKRVAYGLDDVRYTVQLLHPNRRNAAFNREESFVESVDNTMGDLERLEDKPAPAPPEALNRKDLKLKRVKVDDLRKMREKLERDEKPAVLELIGK